HAAEQRIAAPDLVAKIATDGAAHHHPDHAGGQDVAEVGPGLVPFPHQHGNRAAHYLVVEAVEDDRHRRREDEQLLISAKVPVVEYGADINSLHESPSNL